MQGPAQGHRTAPNAISCVLRSSCPLGNVCARRGHHSAPQTRNRRRATRGDAGPFDAWGNAWGNAWARPGGTSKSLGARRGNGQGECNVEKCRVSIVWGRAVASAGLCAIHPQRWPHAMRTGRTGHHSAPQAYIRRPQRWAAQALTGSAGRVRRSALRGGGGVIILTGGPLTARLDARSRPPSPEVFHGARFARVRGDIGPLPGAGPRPGGGASPHTPAKARPAALRRFFARLLECVHRGPAEGAGRGVKRPFRRLSYTFLTAPRLA